MCNKNQYSSSMHVYIQEIARNMTRGVLLRMQSIRMCLQAEIHHVSDTGPVEKPQYVYVYMYIIYI